jgi:O-antigen/teichoic acid export membrane protein
VIRRAPLLKRLVPRGVAHGVGLTLLARGFVMALGAACSVAIARMLGPEGRGASALAGSLGMLGAQVGSLGLGSANTYLGAGARTVSVLLGNALVVGTVGGALAAAAAGTMLAVVPRAPVLDGPLQAATLVAIPVFLTYILLHGLVLGRQDLRVYNASEVLVAVVTAGGLAVAWAVGWITPAGVVTANVAGSAGGAAVLLWSLASRGRPSPRWSTFVESVQLGLRSHAIAVLDQILTRADLVLVSGVLGAGPAGYYAVAQGVATLMLALPAVVGTVVFPRLSATLDAETRWALTWRVAALTAALVAAVALAVAMAARPLIALVFGTDFTPAAPALRCMLPGVVVIAVQTVAVQFLNSFGYPLSIAAAWAAAAALSVGLNLAVIPRWGIEGAASAFSASHAVLTTIVLLLASRRRRN